MFVMVVSYAFDCNIPVEVETHLPDTIFEERYCGMSIGIASDTHSMFSRKLIFPQHHTRIHTLVPSSPNPY